METFPASIITNPNEKAVYLTQIPERPPCRETVAVRGEVLGIFTEVAAGMEDCFNIFPGYAKYIKIRQAWIKCRSHKNWSVWQKKIQPFDYK